MAEDHEITDLLHAWSDGDEDALDQLIPLVFDDLHRMAQYFLKGESDTYAQPPTALLGDLYECLRGLKAMHWDSGKDFFNFAAKVMRRLLVDYARRRKAEKRGGGRPLISLSSIELPSEPKVDLIDLRRALEELAKIDSRQVRIIELKFFTGLRVGEIAELLEISEATVKREWRAAKFWLRRRLGKPLDEP